MKRKEKMIKRVKQLGLERVANSIEKIIDEKRVQESEVHFRVEACGDVPECEASCVCPNCPNPGASE